MGYRKAAAVLMMVPVHTNQPVFQAHKAGKIIGDSCKKYDTKSQPFRNILHRNRDRGSLLFFLEPVERDVRNPEAEIPAGRILHLWKLLFNHFRDPNASF